ERVAEPEGEVQLGRREDQVVGPDTERTAAHQLGRVHEIVVQVHRGLGPPGRAGGVAPEGDVVGAGVGGRSSRVGSAGPSSGETPPSSRSYSSAPRRPPTAITVSRAGQRPRTLRIAAA